MSTRFRWMCLGVLAVGLAVGGLGRQSLAEDAQPAKPKSTAAKPAEDKPAGEKKADKPKLDQAELEKLFAEKLSNCALIGRFTVDGKEGTPKEDTYQITKTSKLRDDYWMFSGIKYGKQEFSIPLVIRVVWAGDTPMMAMDKFTIPGLGTFSFRLMFDGNRYAGTWQHDDVGGHMWGRIERMKAADDAKDAPQGEKKPESKPESDKKEGQAKAEPKANIVDRLQQSVSVNLTDVPLIQVVNDITKATGVKIKIEGDELKSAGVTQNVKVKIQRNEAPALALLTDILAKFELVVVADETEQKAIITTAVAAKARGLTPLTAKTNDQ